MLAKVEEKRRLPNSQLNGLSYSGDGWSIGKHERQIISLGTDYHEENLSMWSLSFNDWMAYNK